MYKEKSQQIIDGYFKLFGKSTDEAHMLESEFTNFADYVNVVAKREIALPILRETLSPNEYRDEVSRINDRCERYRDACVSSVNFFNNVAKQCNLEPFYEGDTKDVYAIGKFAGEFVAELYSVGIGERVPERVQLSDFGKEDKKIDIIMDALKDGSGQYVLPDGFHIEEKTLFSLDIAELYYNDELLGKYYASENSFQMSAPYENLEQCIESIDNGTFGNTENPEKDIDVNNEERE